MFMLMTVMWYVHFLQLCLTVDHPQKVLIIGEAMDFGTCKAKKKNGDSCTQLVNLVSLQACLNIMLYYSNS